MEDNDAPLSCQLMPLRDMLESSVLVVENDKNIRSNLKQSIQTLGFGHVSDASKYSKALEKLQDRPFTHVIFYCNDTEINSKDFLKSMLELDQELICIPSSTDPAIDDVFDLLISGAKGYLVKPYNTQTLELSIHQATTGGIQVPSFIGAKNRNEALIGMVMHALDNTATLMRQARKYDTAKRDLPKQKEKFIDCCDLAKVFAKNGDAGLIEAVFEFCENRQQEPATKLGRLRKRLKTSRPIPK